MNMRRDPFGDYPFPEQRASALVSGALTVAMAVAVFFLALYYAIASRPLPPTQSRDAADIERCERRGYSNAMRDLRTQLVICEDPMTPPVPPVIEPSAARPRVDG